MLIHTYIYPETKTFNDSIMVCLNYLYQNIQYFQQYFLQYHKAQMKQEQAQYQENRFTVSLNGLSAIYTGRLWQPKFMSFMQTLRSNLGVSETMTDASLLREVQQGSTKIELNCNVNDYESQQPIDDQNEEDMFESPPNYALLGTTAEKKVNRRRRVEIKPERRCRQGRPYQPQDLHPYQFDYGFKVSLVRRGGRKKEKYAEQHFTSLRLYRFLMAWESGRPFRRIDAVNAKVVESKRRVDEIFSMFWALGIILPDEEMKCNTWRWVGTMTRWKTIWPNNTGRLCYVITIIMHMLKAMWSDNSEQEYGWSDFWETFVIYLVQGEKLTPKEISSVRRRFYTAMAVLSSLGIIKEVVTGSFIISNVDEMTIAELFEPEGQMFKRKTKVMIRDFTPSKIKIPRKILKPRGPYKKKNKQIGEPKQIEPIKRRRGGPRGPYKPRNRITEEIFEPSFIEVEPQFVEKIRERLDQNLMQDQEQ